MAFTSDKAMKEDGNVALTFETPNGKVIEVFMEQRGVCMYQIRFKSGGKLPKELLGKFTNKKSAVKAVDVYLARVSQKKDSK